MKAWIRALPVVTIAAALAVASCARGPSSYVSDAAKRKEMIDALIADPTAMQEIVDRLLGPPVQRAAVIDRIVKDEEIVGQVMQKLLADDRGKALVASRVAADQAGAPTFIRMLMLTGIMGEAMTQKQAEAIGLGAAFALGNQKRTMVDLRKIGARIDAWAKEREGHYPVCADLQNLDGCLESRLGAKTLEGLRLKDAWGRPFQYRTDREGTLYILVSYATDGEYDNLGKVGPTESYDCDIVFSNGDFIQWPGIIRKSEIR
ncbi:MAG TPA: hypothetical protein VNL37_01035 [Candidatus Polarisedimenticolia bacterium]|nr:hypothetical protein [Candidatus Polarisedimenticolia bacterium]